MKSLRPAIVIVPFVLAASLSHFTEPVQPVKLVWGNTHAVLFPDSSSGTLLWIQRRYSGMELPPGRGLGFATFFDPDSLGAWIPYARGFVARPLADDDTAATRVSPAAASTQGEIMYFARRKIGGRWTAERFLAFRTRYQSAAQYIALSDEQARVFLDSLAAVVLRTPLLSALAMSEQAYYRSHAADTLECPAMDIGNSRWPRYPETARTAGLEGDVWTSYVVTATGRVQENSLQIFFSDDLQFSRAVRASLPFLRFEPSQRDGKPVEVRVLQQFTFRLLRSGPPPLRRIADRCL
jgi:TonB family protein